MAENETNEPQAEANAEQEEQKPVVPPRESYFTPDPVRIYAQTSWLVRDLSALVEEEFIERSRIIRQYHAGFLQTSADFLESVAPPGSKWEQLLRNSVGQCSPSRAEALVGMAKYADPTTSSWPLAKQAGSPRLFATTDSFHAANFTISSSPGYSGLPPEHITVDRSLDLRRKDARLKAIARQSECEDRVAKQHCQREKQRTEAFLRRQAALTERSLVASRKDKGTARAKISQLTLNYERRQAALRAAIADRDAAILKRREQEELKRRIAKESSRRADYIVKDAVDKTLQEARWVGARRAAQLLRAEEYEAEVRDAAVRQTGAISLAERERQRREQLQLVETAHAQQEAATAIARVSHVVAAMGSPTRHPYAATASVALPEAALRERPKLASRPGPGSLITHSTYSRLCGGRSPMSLSNVEAQTWSHRSFEEMDAYYYVRSPPQVTWH